jgi:hypothetical protein
LAQHWGSRFIDMGHCGHINAESGLGDWPQGWAMVQALSVHAAPQQLPH